MTRFFLDLDGVLVDLLTGIKSHEILKGIDTINKNSHYELHEIFNMGEEEFWCQFNDVNFWENLPKYEHSDELFNRLSDKFKENLFILTAPSKWATACATGKINWMKKNYPDFPVGRIILCNKKYLLAKFGNVLLDDSKDKLMDFTACDGDGILFPQEYNREFSKSIMFERNILTPENINQVYNIINKY